MSDILTSQNVDEMEAFAKRCPEDKGRGCRSCRFVLRLVRHIRATSNVVLTESATR